MSFTDIQAGDTIRVTRIGDANEITTRSITVTASYPLDQSVVSADNRVYSAAAGWTAEILITANGIPHNAPVIMWGNADRETSIAFLDGHPLNKTWNHNGRRISEADLLALIGDFRISGLDFRK